MQNEQIISLIGETVAQAGAQLLDCAVARGSGTLDIEVIADTERGISIGEIAVLSKAVQRQLHAVLDPDAGLQLTVSSPGLERPLQHEWQYRRHAGRHVRIETNAGGSLLEGAIEDARDGVVTLRCGGEQHAIALGDITLATILLQPTNKQLPDSPIGGLKHR